MDKSTIISIFVIILIVLIVAVVAMLVNNNGQDNIAGKAYKFLSKDFKNKKVTAPIEMGDGDPIAIGEDDPMTRNMGNRYNSP